MHGLVQFPIMNIQCMVMNHLKLQQNLIKVKKSFIIIERPGSLIGSSKCKESDASVMNPSLLQYTSRHWLPTNEAKHPRKERISRLHRDKSLKSQMFMPLQGNFSDYTADCNCLSHRQTFRSMQEHLYFTKLPLSILAVHFLPLLTITTFLCNKTSAGSRM